MINRLVGVNELAETLSMPPSWIYSRTRIKGDGQIRISDAANMSASISMQFWTGS